MLRLTTTLFLFACAMLMPMWALADENLVARLGIDTDRDAHVYVRGPDGTRLAALCTGYCDVRLAPGTYHLAAGFSHSQLVTLRDPLRLAAGESVNLHVEVRENVLSARLMLGSVAMIVAGLVAVGVGSAKQGDVDHVPTNVVGFGGLIALGAGLVGAVFALPGLEGPSVGAHRWLIPVTEDET